MIITADDPESQAYREKIQQLVRQLRTVVEEATHEAYVDVAEWVVGLRIFLVKALARRVDVEVETLLTHLAIHIRVPDEGNLLALDHAIPYSVMRRVKMDQQALLQAEAGIILRKLEAFFDGGKVTVA